MQQSQPQTLFLRPGETMPNSRLPVLIYRGGQADFESLFARHGWSGIWRNGVYDYDHFHSNAHEVLGIAAGHATLQLGGAEGETVKVAAGDVLVLPAGTGHRRIDRSKDFSVVGAYPAGQQDYDICRTRNGEAELRIARVPLPGTDPVHGPEGPLPRLWMHLKA